MLQYYERFSIKTKMVHVEQPQESSQFEERADFIDEETLRDYTVTGIDFNDIHKKIIAKGAKLIVGPRGTGKTHHLRYAHLICLQDITKPLSVYVSFGKYYTLEPLLYKSTNAIRVFHAWVLAKIIIGVYEAFDVMDANIENIKHAEKFPRELLKNFIEDAARFNELPEYNDLFKLLTIDKTIELLEDASTKTERTRVILLLDDAAIPLSQDYLIEFFDIVRSVKTTHISPKASVYPGTFYGPRFRPGQDAEEVSAWLSVASDNYSEFMENIYQKRFSALTINPDIVELLKYTAFGIPRAFITLIRDFRSVQNKNTQQTFNSVISNYTEFLREEYLSMSHKLPQYKSMIGIGEQVFKKIINEVTIENKEEKEEEKIIHIGILKKAQDSSYNRFNRMISFLREAGLLYEDTPTRVGVGEESDYSRYIPHFAFLLKNRAFSPRSSKGFNAKEIIEFIGRKSEKRPVRRRFSTLLTEEQIKNMTLDLPPCKKCGTIRMSENQKFCHVCGNPLVGESIYEAFLQQSITILPITKLQKERILKDTDIKTIGDILLSQSPTNELQKAKGIGKVRSQEIYKIVEEFLS